MKPEFFVNMTRRTAPLAALATALLTLGAIFLRHSPDPLLSETATSQASPRAAYPVAVAGTSPKTTSSAVTLVSAPTMVATTPTLTSSPVLATAANFTRLSSDEVTPVVLDAAQQRRDAMLKLMAEDPARALAESISWSEYADLPEVLLPYFEKPFNTLATLEVLLVCDAPGREPLRQLLLDGRTYEANIFGARLAQSSKTASPLSGITLDDRAVVAEDVLRVLSAEDARTLADLPLANPDPTRGFATGRPLGSTSVVALAGGQRFLFRSSAEVVEFNTRLASLDARPGPHGGARALFALAYPADASDGFDWPAAEAWSIEMASAWTETPKNVFYIRVDFSDKPGETVSQATLANTLNTSVAESIAAMSYGKTSINAAVSPMVVRLPHPTTTYLPSNNDLLYNHAVAAYLALAGASALNGYDIIGVQFAFIGMRSEGSVTPYGGLATLGGSRQWLVAFASGTIIHELGHNYGLGHANRWSTTDGSVAGAGNNVEYGDPFDIMGGGSGPAGHFHMQGKALLNWLSPSQWTDATVAGSGVRRVHRFDSSATSPANVPRGLRILKGGTNNTDAAQYYWVGYRPGITDNSWLQRGAYLIWERPNFNQGWLLDTTPDSGSSEDSALLLGRTYSDTAAGVHLTPVALGGSGANSWIDVNVQLGAFSGNIAPSATFAPASSLPARTLQTLTVNASDANGDTLAYAWNFGDGVFTENSASVSNTWEVGGTYQVSVTVSDMKGGVTTANHSVTVADPLDEWTTSTIVADRTITDIAYLEGRFIAAGLRYTYFSLDGQTWSENYLSPNYRPGGFATDGEVFILAGYDFDFSLNQLVGTIHRSSDGRSWQKITLPPTAELRDVTHGGGVFVVVGDNGTTLRSVDKGLTWTQSAAPGTADLNAIAHGNGIFLAVGGKAIYSSPDGVDWTDRSAQILLQSAHSIRDVIHADGAFYTGGYLSGIHRTADGGLTWSKSNTPEGKSYDIRSLAAGAGLLVASTERFGNLANPGGTAQLISTDGLVWHESTGTISVRTDTLAYGPGVFLAGGAGGASDRSGPVITGNQPPSASISALDTAPSGEPLEFSATAFDPDGDALTLLWDFGDGSALVEGAAATHTYAVAGNYSVTVVAIDRRGGVSTASHSFTATVPIVHPLTTALDGTGLSWSVGGSMPWRGQSSVTSDSVSAAASGTISHGEQSWVETTVTGPGTLTFRWKVSCEGGKDLLRFLRSGEELLTISGDVDWEENSAAIPAGVHNLRWVFEKDGSGSAGSDRAWLDQVHFTPAPAPALTVVGRPRPFPATALGRKSRPQTLTISNRGGSPSAGLRVAVSGKDSRDFMVIQPVLKNLAPGAATTFQTTFRPRSKGPRRATITVASDAPPVSVTVSGRGLSKKK